MEINETWPHIDKLKDSIEYIYYWRHWMDDGGSDNVVWWKSADGICHCFCQATGEQRSPEPPGKILVDKEVAMAQFDDQMTAIKALDPFEATSQDYPGTSIPANDYVSIKTQGRPVWTIFIRNCKHKSDRVNSVRYIIRESVPELSKFLMPHLKDEFKCG